MSQEVTRRSRDRRSHAIIARPRGTHAIEPPLAAGCGRSATTGETPAADFGALVGLLASAALAAVAVSSRDGSAQQRPPDAVQYRDVNSSDAIAGYVPPGTLVRTIGHLFYRDGELLFNSDKISAQASMRIDGSTLPPGRFEDIRLRCVSTGITQGGCRVLIHGEVRSVAGRSTIRPADIEIGAEDVP